jgi:hypothetical protein
MSRRIQVGLYSTLRPEQARHVYYEPIEDMNVYLSERLRAGSRLAVVRNAGHTVLTGHIS